MAGTLYAFPNDFRANKILIAAQYSGKKVTVDPNFVPGETDKSPEFLKKFPFGKVPAYESGDVKLFQANGIAHFVGNEQTRGADREAEVLQWIGFADNTILPAACTWVYPTQGITQYNKQSSEKAKTEIKGALTVLNDFLSTRTYLVGERITQADITLACTLSMLFENVMDPAFRGPFGNVLRWFVTLVNQPEFKAVLGEVNLCEKMAQFDAKKYNEIHGKAEKAPKGKKGGGGGDSKSPKPKEQKKAASDDVPKKPEKKNPWADLPATTYDMDAFKRCYSNNPADVSTKYFWEHFDREKYSIWRGTYKYPKELGALFMVSNLVRGMMQRLESMKKHAFASILILNDGQDGFLIDSIWFWRGTGLVFDLSKDFQVDYDTYSWKELDPDSEVTKQLVFESFEGETIFDGKTIARCKTYK